MKKNFVKVLALVIVVALMAVSLTACVPKTAEDAKTKMEDKGYVGVADTVIVPNTLKVIGVTAKSVIVYTNGDEAITAIWFAEAEDAKTLYEKWKDDDSKKNFGRSGSCVYYGTEQGVKDFKGF